MRRGDHSSRGVLSVRVKYQISVPTVYKYKSSLLSVQAIKRNHGLHTESFLPHYCLCISTFHKIKRYVSRNINVCIYPCRLSLLFVRDPFQRFTNFFKAETEFSSLTDSEFCHVATLHTYANLLKLHYNARPEVLAAEMMTIQAFWKDTPRRLIKSYRHLSETYCLQRHGQAVPFSDCFILKKTEICFSEKSTSCCILQALKIQHFNI
jgi:hypothetical protein